MVVQLAGHLRLLFTIRGERLAGCRGLAATRLYTVGYHSIWNHDALIRIGGGGPGRRVHSTFRRLKAMPADRMAATPVRQGRITRTLGPIPLYYRA